MQIIALLFQFTVQKYIYPRSLTCVRDHSYACVCKLQRVYTDRVSTTCLTRKSCLFFVCVCSRHGSNLWSLDLESDALPIEPPHRPVASVGSLSFLFNILPQAPPFFGPDGRPSLSDVSTLSGISRQSFNSILRGDGVAQWVERRTRIQRSRVRIPPVRSTRKMCESFSESKCCADSSSVCPTPVCIRTHRNVRTLKIL